MDSKKEEQITKKTDDVSDKYIWGIIYYNPEDSRIWVPKRCKWLGWTINFGHRRGQIAGASFAVAVAAAITYCIKNDVHYSYSFKDALNAIKGKFNCKVE